VSETTLPARLSYLVGGAVLLLVGMMALGAETQYVAHVLHYARALGEPIVRYEGTPVYAPWAVFTWRAAAWAAQRRALFGTAEMIRWGVLVGGGVLFVGGLVKRRQGGGGANPANTHGSARWSTTKEIEKAGFFADTGLVLCQTHDAKLDIRVDPTTGKESARLVRPGRLLRDSGATHTVMFAPTGSYKGVGSIIPSLLGDTRHSFIAWDLKRELWQITAGFRSQFSECVLYDPSSRYTHRYNPLLAVRVRTDNEVRDAQNLAEMLADPSGTASKGGGGGVEEHFRVTAQSFFTGLVLHVLYAEREKTLPRLGELLCDPSHKIHDLLEVMKTTRHVAGGPHPVVAQAAAEAANKSQTELSGLISTAAKALGLYRDPNVAAAVSGADFGIDDLMNAKRPLSLYFVSPPSDQERLRPLQRLVLNQIGRRLMEENPSGGAKPYKHPLTFLLDEFPTLGNMPLFANGLAYFRGYGLKAYLICQSLKQLEEVYGANNSIIDNCDRKITYAANDEQTAERIVKWVGQGTIRTKSTSVSGEKGATFGKKTTSTSEQEQGRALLTADEVMSLPRDEAIVFATGVRPYRGKKCVYYDDARFKARANMKPPEIKRA
jgi:type IV secretion system protein VirD4